MAAIYPPESPEQHSSLAEEVQTSGGKIDAAELERTSEHTEENTILEPRARHSNEHSGNNNASPASHSKVIESAAAGDQTCHSSEPKMAESPGDEKRPFDCPGDEDVGAEFHSHSAENMTKTAENVLPETKALNGAEEINWQVDQASLKKELSDDPTEAVDTGDDVFKDHDGRTKRQDTGPSKPRKSRMVCKECGITFTRREMFYLHRHNHAYKDDLVPLTCKECGLDFKDRRSLIKHRHVHKEEEKEEDEEEEDEEPANEEKDVFQCAACEEFFPTAQKLRLHNCNDSDDKPYRCPLCRKEFQLRGAVGMHMFTHSQESSCTCEECGRKFRDYRRLRCHQRCHPGLKPYECPDCGMAFRYSSVMEDHRRKHTDQLRSYLCTVCGKSFKYSSLLQQHQYLHTGEKSFRCPECGKNFAFAKNMRAHCRQHRLHQANPLPSTDRPTKQTPASAPEPRPVVRRKENAHPRVVPKRIFNCPLCPVTCDSPANLRAHMHIHELEHESQRKGFPVIPEMKKVWDRGYTCPHCPCTYREGISLRLHIFKTHKDITQDWDKVPITPLNELPTPPSKELPTPPSKELPTPPPKKVLPAPRPRKVIKSEDIPAKIRSYKVDIKPHKCPHCEKKFLHRSVLELHMRIHSNPKPFLCNVCGKGFRFSSSLQQHSVIHSGEKPYKCPECGKGFAFPQNLKTHQKLHKEKPFRCTSCRKGYSDEAQLQQHMLSHKGDKPHKCNICYKCFGLAYLLRDHQNTHTGERPHRCEECGKSFSWLSSLLVHQKIHKRKRQSFNSTNCVPASGRARGRGRRGGRPVWEMTKTLALGAPGNMAQTSMNLNPDELQGRIQKEDFFSELLPAPVHWEVGGPKVMQVPSSQQPQSGQHIQDSAPTLVGSPPKSRPLEKHVPFAVPTSTSSGSLHLDARGTPSVVDGAAPWSVQPPLLASPNKLGPEFQSPTWPGSPVPKQEALALPIKEDSKVQDPQAIPTTVSRPENIRPETELQNERASGVTDGQQDQSIPNPVSTSVTHGIGSTLWGIQAPLGTSKKLSSPQKLVNNQDLQLQQKQVASAWANVQNQTVTQKLPIAINPFAQGIGTTVWGFQNSPVGPQLLLTGQLKPGNGQDLQKQPLVSTSQILLNQPSPFFSPALATVPTLALPGAHSLHTVSVGGLPRPPLPNIFFTPQAVLTERPTMPQTPGLPQLATQPEAQKLRDRSPFGPDRVFLCMICGRSFPRELELQLHYMQHAQGKV
ncbi:uncharacterized protein LOC144072527 [Stigmatopora argus]